MNISKYAGYFHDGTIHEIFHNEDGIIISMESSELESEWNEDNLILSKSNRIVGRLHANKLKSVIIDNVEFKILKKTYDIGDIIDLLIQPYKIKMKVCWIKFNEKSMNITDLVTIEITTDEIYWENIPDLFDE